MSDAKPGGRTARIARAVVWAASGLTVVASLLIGRIEEFRAGYTDEMVYRRLARNLLDHGFYGYARGVRLAYRAPGFPFFDAGIRLLNDGQASVRFANAILAGATVFFAAWIARRLFGSVAAAVTAVLLLMVGTLPVYASYELSETLATATLVGAAAAAIAAIDRKAFGWAAASGVLLGVSSLVRPQTLFLVVALPVVVGLAAAGGDGRRRALVGVVLAAAAIATLVPWTIRNAVRLHAFVPVSTYGGVNFFIANNDEANGQFRPADEWVTPEEYARITALPEAAQDREWYRMAFAFMRAHPATTLHNWLRDGVLFVRRADALIRRDYRIRGGFRPPVLDDRLLWIGAAPGIALAARRRGRARALLPAMIVAYFIAFFMAFVPLARFRHGVVPFLAVYTGAAASTGWMSIARRRAPAVEPVPAPVEARS